MGYATYIIFGIKWKEYHVLTFPLSRVKKFKHANKALRWGQAFHQFMKLDKITGSDKSFCDKLYTAPDDVAMSMVRSRTDNAN